MNLTDEEKTLIRHESLRKKPYRCTAGKLTIGVGRNLEDRGITTEEALYLMRNDIAACRRERSALDVPPLTPAREGVLLNMLFNLGLPRVLGFARMLQALREEDYHRAADEMLDSKWARQVGKRAEELAKTMREGK